MCIKLSPGTTAKYMGSPIATCVCSIKELTVLGRALLF